ncbi:bifunctional diaminohydroxyphosphoribosylaminopyrimidine deaminase/5-amino-6-(5-phosphoribosylamino)uracil reductase RibD [Bdellovibrio sp. SKB1291214]|uniref:bifunctional diaminohydroxyphosphoribosylaminopyrimidine deaminase/5-amino-6-(5-phosphoribosylamino)uracil reductase RibD n=1 Tax=Bdellovibrio sp. SKB1291214 TaxID=1732569 RepID=UPI0020CBD418|nr:bifunctional diaminohydroxyphosphoribosylaminopyrimidine deaminase/5-amino-6-(5-phosphoribosylamino)uracil reductase RibD [Bdellovibrio sp. SKB1291214]UYL08641.1 bifunctional diaminohydroxyphosphoribosylaminopyrimidine deaminase/5-amino-6-(5-phosphoribosylamino)uracil reductase RibD [Bdellovibrio sp. SKB1291214]
MALAISEAYKGATRVSPNPLVGCVVLDSTGCFLAAGHHEFYGGPHAEVNAVKNLSSAELKGAHVIVTLEPCAHEGKTPSCAKMLATLPIKKVTFGLIDPNPLVAGQGAEILRQVGIEADVYQGSDLKLDQEMRIKLEEVCEAFLWNFRHKKVFVALKMASSLDGQVALKSGESQWITGSESREYVHYLRASYDGLLVGKGTIDFDNPSLNIRHPHIEKKNKVIVIDGEGELLQKYSDLKVAAAHTSENVFWCVAEELKEDILKKAKHLTDGPQLVFVKTKMGGDLDLEDLLAQLYKQGFRSILVEGGALTASSFVQSKLVNRLYMFQAPIIMGAGGSRSWTETMRIDEMKDKIFVQHPTYKTFGNDFMITGRIE